LYTTTRILFFNGRTVLRRRIGDTASFRQKKQIHTKGSYLYRLIVFSLKDAFEIQTQIQWVSFNNR